MPSRVRAKINQKKKKKSCRPKRNYIPNIWLWQFRYFWHLYLAFTIIKKKQNINCIKLVRQQALNIGGSLRGNSRWPQINDLIRAIIRQLPLIEEELQISDFDICYSLVRNQDGYKYTVEYAKKIDIVSPVWFTLKFKGPEHIYIDGDQDIREDYLDELSRKNPSIVVAPRLYIDANDLQVLLNSLKSGQQGQIVKRIKQQFSKFGGIVLDTPLISYQSLYGFNLMKFIESVARSLKDQNKEFVFMTTVQGFNEALKYDSDIMDQLLAVSDRVLVCTYDYPKQVPNFKPLSPINWVKENIQYFSQFANFKKILLGLPFYGFSLSAKGEVHHIKGSDLMQLEDHAERTALSWNNEYKECMIVDKDEKQQLYYPCLKFFETRLYEFKKFKLGFFVWEGGQGLKQFYEFVL